MTRSVFYVRPHHASPQVLEILRAGERVSGAELAERLPVDVRTVQRYIVRLQDLSIPVESVRGAGGYYRLRPGFRLPPLMLTDGEETFERPDGFDARSHLHDRMPFVEAAYEIDVWIDMPFEQAARTLLRGASWFMDRQSCATRSVRSRGKR